MFNLTSHPEHLNLSISKVADAVLWSYRNHSVTNSYYRLLYHILLSTFAVVILFFTATRITITA